MRLTSDRAKQAILHPLQDVREAAVAYFTTSFDPDPQVMSLVIQAIERYGERAFEPIPYANNLVQTEETVRWLIARLAELEPAADEIDDEDYAKPARSLTHALSGANPQLLAAHETEIAALPLSAETQLAIRDRISLLNAEPESLWREWEDFCENYDDYYDPQNPVVARVGRVVEALARHPAFASPRVLEVLIRSQQVDSFENNSLGWMEPLAVRLAGRLRLEQAIPVLVEKMAEEDADWLNDECIWALSRIGGDNVVRALAEVVLDRGEDFQFRAAAILEDIHTDYSVQTALNLLQYDHADLTRVQLFKALLINGAPMIYDTVRQWLHDHERVPDWLDLRADLITSATIMEVDFPELAEWRVDMQQDGEFRRQWYAQRYGPLLALNEMKGMQAFQQLSENLARQQADDSDDDWDEDFDSPDDSAGPLRAQQHAGRNDPCPCGSGKKYKKCCYYKDRDANLN